MSKLFRKPPSTGVWQAQGRCDPDGSIGSYSHTRCQVLCPMTYRHGRHMCPLHARWHFARSQTGPATSWAGELCQGLPSVCWEHVDQLPPVHSSPDRRKKLDRASLYTIYTITLKDWPEPAGLWGSHVSVLDLPWPSSAGPSQICWCLLSPGGSNLSLPVLQPMKRLKFSLIHAFTSPRPWPVWPVPSKHAGKMCWWFCNDLPSHWCWIWKSPLLPCGTCGDALITLTVSPLLGIVLYNLKLPPLSRSGQLVIVISSERGTGIREGDLWWPRTHCPLHSASAPDPRQWPSLCSS